MDISVRRAAQSDLEFVSQDGYTTMDAVRRKIGEGEVVLVEVDGEPAGYVRLEFLWSIRPYVALIRVLDRYRGRGLSRALLEYVETDLRGEGHTALFSSSQVDEAEAQEWHRHMGFEECGMITGLNEGGVGEVFFRKAL
ncbi:MAG TPA: GNAT family N-acetyltransferase [Chromatiales bacterium]|nr:GNAT family N-acetyltransferase [Chromatiales bacterium]